MRLVGLEKWSQKTNRNKIGAAQNNSTVNGVNNSTVNGVNGTNYHPTPSTNTKRLQVNGTV